MTVASEACVASLSWTGAESSFVPGFSAADVSHVLVISRDPATGVDTALTRTVHFNVSLGGGGAVTVTPIALPTAPKTLVIYRDTPALQPTDFIDGEDFSAETHELLADRWARLAAERKADMARTMRLAIGETFTGLPSAAARASLLLGFDADGDPAMYLPATAELGSIVYGAGPYPLFNDPAGPAFRAITGDDLPTPSTITLGGIFAKAHTGGFLAGGLDSNGNLIAATTGSLAAPALTGAAATSAFTITQQWNTSGAPELIKASLTDLGHGVGARLMALYGGAGGTTLRYSIDTSGNVAATGTMSAASLFGETTLNARTAVAPPAGGTAGSVLLFSTTAGFGIWMGSGAPTVSAGKGSLYLRTNGSTTNDRAYINTDGGTTWTALTTAA